jgi:predicted nucleic acid-binding protein
MDLYEEIVIERHAVPATEALALALRYNLTTYDAAYLWLAAHLDAPLATFDERLAAAAREHLR